MEIPLSHNRQIWIWSRDLLSGLILDFLLLWFIFRLFFNDPMVFPFYNVGEVLYNWTGVRFAEIKRLYVLCWTLKLSSEMLWFHVVVLQKTARNFFWVRAARAARPFFLIRQMKFLICGVFGAIPVVDAEAP